MKGGKKTQRIILGIAFVLVLAGLILIIGELSETIAPIKLFGGLNLGLILIVIGGIVTFLAPKPTRKKKKYSGF